MLTKLFQNDISDLKVEIQLKYQYINVYRFLVSCNNFYPFLSCLKFKYATSIMFDWRKHSYFYKNVYTFNIRIYIASHIYILLFQNITIKFNIKGSSREILLFSISIFLCLTLENSDRFIGIKLLLYTLNK